MNAVKADIRKLTRAVGTLAAWLSRELGADGVQDILAMLPVIPPEPEPEASPAEARIAPAEDLIEAWWENYLADCGDSAREALPREVWDAVVRAGMAVGDAGNAMRERVLRAEAAYFAHENFSNPNPKPNPKPETDEIND